MGPLAQSAFLLFSGTRDYDHLIEVLISPGFDHQRCADNANAERILTLDFPEPLLLPLHDRRVNQTVELCASVRIAEDDFTEGFAIDGPIWSYHALSESLNDGVVNRLTGFIELVGDRVRIDQMTSKRDEHLAHRALACSDSTGEPYPQHQ